MNSEKNGKNLTQWLLAATIALLALVLGLQLWQMFGAPKDSAPPPAQDAAGPENSLSSGKAAMIEDVPALNGSLSAAQAPASGIQTPAAQAPASGGQEPVSGTPAQQAPASGGEEAAKQAAFAHAGVSADGVTVTKCKLDWDDGCQVYEIEFRADGIEYDYEIDASSCAVLKAGQEWGDRHHGGGPASQQQAGAFIGEEAAKSAALTHAGVSADGAGCIRCELDEDDGLWIYEVEFQAGGLEYEYEISASDGTVLKAEQDR